jgi:hypothetical protein
MSNEFKLIDDEILKKLNETMIELDTTVYKYDHGFFDTDFSDYIENDKTIFGQGIKTSAAKIDLYLIYKSSKGLPTLSMELINIFDLKKTRVISHLNSLKRKGYIYSVPVEGKPYVKYYVKPEFLKKGDKDGSED